MFKEFIQNIKKLYIQIKNSPFFDKTPVLPKTPLTQQDYEFMNSLSSAVMQIRPNKLHWVLISFVVTIFLFIIWASFAKIDEISRGSGKVVPSGQNQLIQNLEGGIVSEILVREGEFVEKDQVLIRISNEKSTSTAVSHNLKILSLQAQKLRLEAELKQGSFDFERSEVPEMNTFLENEKELFQTNQRQLNSKVQILKEQYNQKTNELQDAQQTIEHLKFSVEMISKEVEMTKPMVERGIRSQVDFLKLQREESDAKQRLQSAFLSVPKLKSEIAEIKKKIDETYEANESQTREKLNEIVTSLKELQATSTAYDDQVLRTTVRSPQNGIVQKLHVNTIGGAIKPAQDLIEIVPTDYSLLVEVKILPSDIAFIYHGQKAIVKFSAYDFSIFGGLEGYVVNISPDTITEKDDKTYYLVRIETEKNYIGTEEKPMKIIPGMVADVDIITGKKSILDYILKPILKTKQYTFTER
ncbi:HlyD family type I secretion periplasmic adaptor subunit [Arcobacter sp. FWKO B]|uniref:HlyD family type I secretion periplasmic adaptor subunit n=1 Tax=Arcobacter sp. FWKO B TaxID=2593672 RepID=UPI0018A51798|nr:HlyD family type I secretion periplasmic adaptor subunit [Arcobacter sp. FWKO B]QOG11368.1 HlyD family type I secretion periplasmic adaptor subunit [Arcobacter sp. FWKO B]